MKAAALAAVALFSVGAATAAAAPGDTELVARLTGGTPANGDSSNASISGDGRFVFFYSHAANLIPPGNYPPVGWLRDMVSGTTVTVGSTHRAFMTPDARFLAELDDAVPEPARVVRVDRSSGTRTSVTEREVTAAPSSALDERVAISDDGARIAFTRTAFSVTAGKPLGIYVKNFVDGSETLVSRASGIDGTPADDAYGPAISGNGRYVAFESTSDGISGEDANDTTDVYVRDLATAQTTLVSRATGATGAAGDADSFNESISTDGRYVAFSSTASNLSAENTDGVPAVYVRDMVSGTTALVSRASGLAGAGANNDAFDPSISADGRFIAFTSLASNLDGPNSVRSIFVRDLGTARTTLVSRASGAAGALGDQPSDSSAISADGRFVAFESISTTFVPGAFAGLNVYRRDLGPAPPIPASGGAGGGGGSGFIGARARPVPRCGGLRATRVGSSGKDVIRGTAKRDVIVALGGDDTVIGKGGADVICLGAGNDTADGGAGADRIFGDAGKDGISGGAGADRLDGGAGADAIRGGAGLDHLLGGAGADRLLGGAGRDVLKGGPGVNRLTA